MQYLFYGIIGTAAAIMLYGLVRALGLRSVARLDKVKQSINLLIVLILFFLAGYAAAPFAPSFSAEVTLILMSLVFFFGALFVVFVLGLMRNLIQAVQEMIDYEQQKAAAEAELVDMDAGVELPDMSLPAAD